MTGGIADEFEQLLQEWRERQQKAFADIRKKESEIQRIMEGLPRSLSVLLPPR